MTELNQLLLEFQGLRNTIKQNHEELTEKVESSVSSINVKLEEVTSQLSAYHKTIEKVAVLKTGLMSCTIKTINCVKKIQT